MKIGTKSVLFGAHCFLIHWLFVAAGWFTLYRFQRVQIGGGVQQANFMLTTVTPPIYTSFLDPRLWFAFLLHDIGYWGKPNMDGDEGERHPEIGARICGRLFGDVWYRFVVCHSRFYAKKLGLQPSPLCFADKMAITFQPVWLYLPMVNATGEIREYLKMAETNSNGEVSGADQLRWYNEMRDYVRRWILEHKDGREDTWTDAGRETTRSGVWK